VGSGPNNGERVKKRIGWDQDLTFFFLLVMFLALAIMAYLVLCAKFGFAWNLGFLGWYSIAVNYSPVAVILLLALLGTLAICIYQRIKRLRNKE
jgi:hypothetical protein